MMPPRSILVPGLLSLALALGQAQRAAGAEEAQPAGAGATEARPGGHGGSAGGNPNTLEFKPPLALATLIVFLVLLFVLWRFAWGPLAKALHDREHHNEEILRQTE